MPVPHTSAIRYASTGHQYPTLCQYRTSASYAMPVPDIAPHSDPRIGRGWIKWRWLGPTSTINTMSVPDIA
eukprot:1378358-Rhodomonas_salina.1